MRKSMGAIMEKLKPCPFCWSRAELVSGGRVCCTECGAIMTHTISKNSTAAWNTRATREREISFVEALIAAKKIVKQKEVFKKFIDGTPLENDIAVWMAEFLVKGGKP